MGRQPDDRLGRTSSWSHVFEHRRQILRGCAESDTYTHADTDNNSEPCGNANSDCNCNCNAHGKPDSDSDYNRDIYGNTDANDDAESVLYR